MLIKFDQNELNKLWKPREDSSGEDNGQVTIIGGSKLFHGAPILALRAATRLVDMVFFSSPEPAVGEVAVEIKAGLASFIWVPWEEVGEYVNKSEAVLIGPGFMRFHSETANYEQRFEECDEECQKTMTWTRERLEKYREKKWVIDGGSLQVIKPEWIPQKAILTPNQKEFEMLFSTSPLTPLHSYGEGNERGEVVAEMARKYSCIIVYKGPTAYVTDGYTTYEIKGGNAGLTKGGTGDVLAGVTVGLAAKNEPLLAAAAASFIVKKTADGLYEKVGYHFNADDLAEEVFGTFHQLLGPIG